MRASELSLDDVLALDRTGGIIRFAGERTLLIDAVALGLLRKQLIDAFGQHAARGLLTRFGFSHGWRTAAAMKGAIAWDDEREWKVAGGRLHRLHGLVSFTPIVRGADEGPGPFAEAMWNDSYEAEQHLLHAGRCDTPVCWSLVGFASGYLSHVNNRTFYCLETRCRGMGDTVCRMEARAKEDWPPERQAELAYYETDCLTESLKQLSGELRKVDARLREKQREMKRLSDDPSGLVARSAPMKGLVAQARRVASVDASVLLLGESGSGKERIARLIHEASPRAPGPFIGLNCAAVPEALLESELFGHARGSFTGALTDRAGLFEAAKGGTVLLDEIGELPQAMQAKLLRVIQEREVRRVGENKTRSIDVRLVAATHRDLKAEVAAGRFREDLYYRLRVVELAVPPLRERPEDIVALARVFLAAACARAQQPVKELAPEVARRLVDYRWPGNVRELSNAMERAAVLSLGRRIELSDLPPEVVEPVPRSAIIASAGRTLDEVEREHILATLAAVGGNRARAAQTLGIGQATLFRKLKAWKELSAA